MWFFFDLFLPKTINLINTYFILKYVSIKKSKYMATRTIQK